MNKLLKTQPDSIRKCYDSLGVDSYYSQFGNDYINPHTRFTLLSFEDIFFKHLLNVDSNQFSFNRPFKVLDLACGDGLISKHLISLYNDKRINVPLSIEGSDKYLFERYKNETGLNCYNYSFEEIASFNHSLAKQDLIVISYAIDLVAESYLANFLYALSCICDNLLIIRPNNHKLDSYCWELSYSNKFSKSKGFLYKRKINF